MESRERARSLIMAGNVLVDGVAVTKAGSLINTDSLIEIKEEMPYVSRGGLKLEAALDHFRIDLIGMTVMDAGASTGGFTDCMLKRGAVRVYAVDVGYGQLSWQLRNDPRVTVIERTNIRKLPRDTINEELDFATIDVSFISLLKVLPKVKEFLKKGGEVLALIKPQFEVGKGEVDKGGVIRSEEKRRRAVTKVEEGVESMGFIVLGIFESPVKGQKGNIEYFIHMRRNV